MMNRLWLPVSIFLFLLLCGITVWSQTKVVAFTHVDEARRELAAAGFYCTSDTSTHIAGAGFLISRDSVSRDEVIMLKKAGPMGPEWRGKVWVTTSPRDWMLQTIPDDADTRTWGKVVAFGDGAMLAELDRLLARSGMMF